MRLVYAIAILSGSAAAMAQPVLVPAEPEETIELLAAAPALAAEAADEAWIQATPAPRAEARVFALGPMGGSYLGIGAQEIDAARAKDLKLKEVRGVEVTRVEEDSPAEKAGLRKGDVVLEYNGERVEGTRQFERLVRETPPGRQVTLVVSRNGATQTITATLGERKNFVFERKIIGPDFERDMAKLREDLQGLRVDPKFHEDMSRLQDELGAMRLRIPEMPQVFMSLRSGMLGIEAESLTSQLAEFFGVKQGVLVRSVMKDSAAEKAGIKAGDVIVRVDKEEVASPSELTRELRRMGSGRSFPVTVVRNRQEMVLNVVADEKPSGTLERRLKLAPQAGPRPRAVRVQGQFVPSPML
jgi:serine protease Do